MTHFELKEDGAPVPSLRVDHLRRVVEHPASDAEPILAPILGLGRQMLMMIMIIMVAMMKMMSHCLTLANSQLITVPRGTTACICQPSCSGIRLMAV